MARHRKTSKSRSTTRTGTVRRLKSGGKRVCRCRTVRKK